MWKWMPGLALGLGALMTAAPAAAGTYYRYTTESGSLAFTDELKRVPARYRDAVEEIEARDLRDYERTSVSEPGASTVAVESSLSSIEERERPTSAEPPRRASSITLDSGEGVLIEVPASDEEPVTVKHDILRWENGRLHRYTIIRRGGRLVAKIRQD